MEGEVEVVEVSGGEVAAEVAVAARHLDRRLVLRHLSHSILLGHARLDEERLALEGDAVERRAFITLSRS